MSKAFEAKVFEKDGNRFLIPGVWREANGEYDHGGTIYNALMFSVVLGVKEEPDWLRIETDSDGRADFIHVPHFIADRGFAHGGMEVLLISGPLFDEANKAPEVAASTQNHEAA